MDLGDYVNVLRSRWLTVVSIALLTIASAAAATLLMTPQYTSTTRMFFAVQGGESVSDLAQGSTFTERQMSSYAEVARSPLVLAPVAEELGVDSDPREMASAVSASVATDTTILTISATDDNPTFARDLAN